MYGLIIAITTLLAVPFLFPEETLSWIRKAGHWLATRRLQYEQETATLERTLVTNKRWGTRLQQLYHLPQTQAETKRYEVLVQTLATAQRYPKNTDRRQFPTLYRPTERVRRYLETELCHLQPRPHEAK